LHHLYVLRRNKPVRSGELRSLCSIEGTGADGVREVIEGSWCESILPLVERRIFHGSRLEPVQEIEHQHDRIVIGRVVSIDRDDGHVPCMIGRPVRVGHFLLAWRGRAVDRRGIVSPIWVEGQFRVCAQRQAGTPTLQIIVTRDDLDQMNNLFANTRHRPPTEEEQEGNGYLQRHWRKPSPEKQTGLLPFKTANRNA